METKTLDIKQIVIDRKLYPRDKTSVFVASDYARAMRCGEKFPPIEVALRNGKYVLIDGATRIQAHKDNKKTKIEAVIHKGLTDAEIFARAIKTNLVHGERLTQLERAKCILRLQKMGVNDLNIAKIVCIPAPKLKNFTDKRVALITSHSGKTYDFDVKPAFRKPFLAMPDSERETITEQQVVGGSTFISQLDDLTYYLENGLYEKTREVKERLKRLNKLITKILHL